jgi:hypothetical protein
MKNLRWKTMVSVRLLIEEQDGGSPIDEKGWAILESVFHADKLLALEQE